MNPDLDPKELRDIPDPFAAYGNAELRVPELGDLPESPTRSNVRTLRAMALGLAIACEAGLLGIMGLRDKATLSVPVVIYGVFLPLGSAALTLLAVRGGTTRTVRVGQLAFASALVFLVTTFLAQAPGDESAGGMLKCVIGGTMMAAGPAMLSLFSMRHAFVTGATWRTAALGLLCGLVGAAATRLYCPNDAFWHVLAGHGAPIALATIVVALLGTRLTRV